MFEKIGLPPKPSLRGNNWVVDASHCQGCSSQFSFINRKHHCRRCGGIFCGSCTQHRMILRGQGDSPVRICDPCKTLEEAARFESRNRHKSKVSKGGSGLASQKEDDILLNEKHASLSKLAGGSSSSVSLGRVIEADGSNHSSSSNQASSEVEVETPETLREKALEEKKKYRMLKDEGKSEEALRAFKRGKELERQAAALDISLRKNRRKALSSGAVDDTQDIKDHFRAASEKVASSVSKKSKDKEDFSAELRELGWSDLDLHEGEKKPTTLTVEGDLSSLVREVSAKPVPVVSADRSLVLGHKKKALELKRAGNLSEAKEELKKAKILERKIEEEELLGSTDESDDELSSLIRSMDAEPDKFNIGINIDNIPSFAGDFDVDGNLEVTEEDMEDPDMASALESLGWVEESVDIQVKVSSVQKRADGKKHETGICTGGSYAAQKHAPRGKLTIQRELIAVKKKALALRREDRLDESEQELQKAKVLEAELEESSKASTYGGTSSVTEINIGDEDEVEDDANQVTDQDLQDPTYFSLLKNMGWEDEHTNKPAPALPSQQANENAVMSTGYTADYAADYLTPGKSKKEIQRDLLALKRKALTLRRQGEMDAADEVLEIAKSLEVQLQELEKQTTKQVPSKNVEHLDKVTVLKPEQIAPDKEISHFQEPKLPSQPVNSPPNKNNISQEILSHKRKAVALKREGKLSEAKEELRLAKLLERQVDEAMSQDSNADSSTSSVPSKEKGSPNLSSNRETSTNAGSNTSHATSKEKGSPNPPSSRERFKLQQESLAHKRQALKLRREGKITEAEAELELAMSLESRLQELDAANSDSSKGADEVEDFLDPQLLSALQSIGFEDLGNVSRSKETHQSKDTTKSGGAAAKADSEAEHLAERIKSEKLMAVNLKRAGKQTEALAALRRAKAYEKKLHSLDAS